MTATQTAVIEVTFHTHTDRFVRPWIGRNVNIVRAQRSIERQVLEVAAANWARHAEPASDLDGMLIRIDGTLVGKVDTVGMDAPFHDSNLVDWSWNDWPTTAATVADWIGK